MKNEESYQDKRIKRKLFPVSTFIAVYAVFAVFTTIQMNIIGEFVDYKNIPKSNQIAIFVFWLIAAVIFTILTSSQIKRHYEKPIDEFSKAARRVAQGDFSVYLAPQHTVDKYTNLDVVFTDFNKMVEELGSIETLKTDFFSNVSHEMKTPLAVIQNNAQLLHAENLTDDRRKEYSETILHAARRLSNLITNMLKLNKLEKQAIQPMPQSYDLCAQICECALQFEDAWETKKIEFEAELEDMALIYADRELLELVWTNLLSNAVKFTPAGGSILLTQSSSAEEVTVSIADTGCGMEKETMEHIFDKFYQGDTSHSTEGNGLGLALVQRILQLSEGTVSVESSCGKGTVFTVSLPVSRRAGEEYSV